jgi:pyruvate kinase
MASVVWEADLIHDDSKFATSLWNDDLHQKLSLLEQELDAVAHSAVQAAITMGAKKILCITTRGHVARAIARHQPSVPVLTFCTDPQVARRLQLHRCIIPIMLQIGSRLNPLDPDTRMGLLRAEAIRTARELGFVQAGDRIILVDRTAGKAHDNHEFAHNMKVVTVRDM